jgi:hypothetical protein
MTIRQRCIQLLYVATLLLVFWVSGEAAARVDDWLYWDISPVASMPNSDRELFIFDGQIKRGRPHGRFKQYRLNQYGFRNPEMTEIPNSGTCRVMILGASESFGIQETDEKEYPRQLAALLRASDDRYEIVNVALDGLSGRSMKAYWINWASRFRPRTVIIYPASHLYLNDPASNLRQRPAEQRLADDAADAQTAPFESRFRLRLRDSMPFVQGIWKSLRPLLLGPATAGNESAPALFESVPEERLLEFTHDMESVVAAIQESGSRPVLVTHARSAASPPRPEDAADLENMRAYTPRATADVLSAFEDEANRRLLMVGRTKGIPVIDAAKVLSGRRQFFTDLVHFTDAGAAAMAELLAQWIKNDDR